jgi:hypothetical protein
MDFFISFFRDTLSGKTYLITVVLCIFLIFAAIGYIVTKKIEDKSKKPLAFQRIN